MSNAELAKNLKCYVCRELLNEPKLLACTHTFCEKCLHQRITSQEEQIELPCPICQKITSLENGDVSKLQTNLTIEYLLEQVKLDRKFCTTCHADSESIAVFYCWQCNEFLCELCHSDHGKFKCISRHDIVRADEVKSGKMRAKQLCGMHPRDELELVCSTCKEPICFKCLMVSHGGSEHQVVEILAFQKTIRSQAKSLREESEKKMSIIEVYIAEIEEHLVKVGSVLDQRVAEVHQKYEDRLQKLTEGRDGLNKEIQRQRQMMITELECIKEVNTKSLAGIKSLCETVTKAAEGFIEGEALVTHNKICNELEEMLKIDNPGDQELKDIGKRAEGLKFRTYQSMYESSKPLGAIYQTHGNQSPHNASITADMDWNLKKMNSLSVAGARYSDMAPTPDGKMAVGYEMGGIDLFTPDMLLDTVLQDVKVSSLAVFSNGRYVVRDMDGKVKVYDSNWMCSYSMDTYGKGKLHVDQEDNLYVSNYGYNSKCTVFRLTSCINDASGREKEELVEERKLFEGTDVPYFIPFNHRCDKLICRNECSVEVLHDKDVVYERSFGTTSLRLAVLHDDTILVGLEEDGLVTIEWYTYQLRCIKTVLTGYRIDGDSFQLRQFSTGEIALCDGKALHVFHKA